MDTIKYQHKDLANGRWGEMSFYLQMGNLGSEVSRSLKWFRKNEKRFQVSFERALELFDLTIEAAAKEDEAKPRDVGMSKTAKLEELCRAREEFCDYFLGNSWGTDPKKMMKYYDEFAIVGRGL